MYFVDGMNHKTETNMATSTKWGAADSSKKIAHGIMLYTTPSHGGFRVSPTKLKLMPVYFQRKDGWYEEDCEWCMVALSFPTLFTIEQVNGAHETCRNWYPDAYIAWRREHDPDYVLLPEYSRVLRDRAQKELIKDKIVGVWSFGDWKPGVPKGMVLVGATLGGAATTAGGATHYLVPVEEFTTPMVIDPSRHEKFTGEA
jgi:hypothetical protein